LGNAKKQGAKEEREKWQNVVDKKDATLAEQAGVIGEQAALIAELQAQLGEK